MDLTPQGWARSFARLGAAAQNALEVARYGGLETGEEPAPYEVVAEERVYRLRHYFPDQSMPAKARPPIGLVVGSQAGRVTWPTVAAWAKWRDGAGVRPDVVVPMPDDESARPPDVGSVARVSHAAGLASDIGTGAVRNALGAVTRGRMALRQVASDALDQIPRLNRLEGIGPATHMSLGLLLDEQATRSADRTFFLFEGRGHSYGDAKRRIDNIVRGLVSVGVRQGEHVGVLMGTRPSAVGVVAALSRVGAVVVMMRPDGSVEREAELGQVTRIIADPEHAALAAAADPIPVLVLGGGGEPWELGFGLTDMERIDPGSVALPAWYAPNPGRGRDLAFVLFTGRGDATRVNRITNRRWALSAFGTASAATLSGADTVYCVTPIHHPSGLLTSIGGAVAGGSRLALATRFEPATFWDEVRRYGVTIVSYTWALVGPLLAAPPDPGERHHPVRLFVGSGMPTGLWRRVLERFHPAGVLEFYASTEGEAVLVNMAGTKIGAKGRPLPGSAPVRIAAYDAEAGRLVEGPDGFARSCHRGEVGMLLAGARPDRGGLIGTPLRGVFARDDAWESTGDLFRRDGDGDFWLVGDVASLVRTAQGAVAPAPVEDALAGIDAVDLAVAYGVATGKAGSGGPEIVMAAVTLRAGAAIHADDLGRAVAGFDDGSRPSVIRVVDAIPVTTWFRPLKGPLRREGVPVPVPADQSTAWGWDAAASTYRPLTAARRRRLLA